MIATDDPKASITGVFLGGTPAPITGHQGGFVTIEMTGTEKGIICQQDLGVALADGRRVSRDVNICLNDWKVVLALGEEGGVADTAPVAPAPAGAPQPAAAASSGAGEPPAAPSPTVAGPASAEPPMTWAFATAGGNASLVRGIPQTDSSQFVATCKLGSGRVRLSFPETNSGVNPGASLTISLAAGEFLKAYPGVASPVEEESGISHPEADIPVGDPLWQAMIHETVLNAAVPPQPLVPISLAGSAQPTRQFLDACA